jgi:type VI secretion system secreted protein Hcp
MKRSLKLLLSASISVAAASLPPVLVADTKIFMETNPPITGTAVDSSFPGAIELVSWGWGLFNSGDFNVGERIQASIQQLTLVKNLDRASPRFYPYILEGNRLTAAEIKVMTTCLSPEQYNFPLMRIVLTNPLFTSANMGIRADVDGAPTETVSMVFSEICVEVNEPDLDCSEKPSQGFGYNVTTNTVDRAASCPTLSE